MSDTQHSTNLQTRHRKLRGKNVENVWKPGAPALLLIFQFQTRTVNAKQYLETVL